MVRSKKRIVKRVNHALQKCGLPPTAQEWPVRYEKIRGSYIGLASCDKDTGEPVVKIAEHLFDPKNPKQAESTYAHEIIHHALPKAMAEAKLDWDGSHGKTFRRVAHAAGLRDWGSQTWKWKYTCPKCGAWVKTHKRGRRFCTHCPPTYERRCVTVDGIKSLATVTMRPMMKLKRLF